MFISTGLLQKTLWFLLALLLLSLALLLWKLNTTVSVQEPSISHQQPVQKPVPDSMVRPQQPAIVIQASKPVLDSAHKTHGIAVIIDDIAYSMSDVRSLLALPYPLALSVLPNAPHARQAATLIHLSNKTLMLHMPMEPESRQLQQHMDAMFLHRGQTASEIQKVLHAALRKVPFAEGLNNHMGSLLTQKPMPMQQVMLFCRQQKMFFVDSRTIAASIAADAAKKADVAWAVRRVFLDHEQDEAAIIQQWERAKALWRKGQSVVVIAHPHKQTMHVLQTQILHDAQLIVGIKRLLHGGDAHAYRE